MTPRYQLAKELQRILDLPLDDREYKLYAVRDYLSELNEDWDGGAIRAIHADSALHIDDQLTTDSLLFPYRVFGEVIVKGAVPNITCIDRDGRLIVSLPVFEGVVLGPKEEIEADLVNLDLELSGMDTILPLGTRMARPLHIPFEDMTSIHFAA